VVACGCPGPGGLQGLSEARCKLVHQACPMRYGLWRASDFSPSCPQNWVLQSTLDVEDSETRWGVGSSLMSGDPKAHQDQKDRDEARSSSSISDY